MELCANFLFLSPVFHSSPHSIAFPCTTHAALVPCTSVSSSCSLVIQHIPICLPHLLQSSTKQLNHHNPGTTFVHSSFQDRRSRFATSTSCSFRVFLVSLHPFSDPVLPYADSIHARYLKFALHPTDTISSCVPKAPNPIFLFLEV